MGDRLFGEDIRGVFDAILRSSNAAIKGSVASMGSSYFVRLRVSGLLTSRTLFPIFNMTDAPAAIGSSDLSLRELFPGLLLCAPPPPPPISKLGTEIAIPLGADFELFIGETGGVAFGVLVLGDFDPKFQNEDLFPEEDGTSTLFLSRRCNTFGDGGP